MSLSPMEIMGVGRPRSHISILIFGGMTPKFDLRKLVGLKPPTLLFAVHRGSVLPSYIRTIISHHKDP